MDSFAKFNCVIDQNFKNETEMVRGFAFYDYSIEPHTHDFYEVNIVLRGSGTHLVGENHFFVKTGDVFVIPPTIIHGYFDCEKMDVFHLLIKPVFIEKIKESEHIDGLTMLFEIEPLLRRTIEKSLFLSLSPEQISIIHSDLEAISDSRAKVYPDSENFKNYTALKLICHLSYLLKKQNDGDGKVIASDIEYSIIKVIDYIYKNYCENITAETLCKIANMSRTTFFRNFKRYCGKSPMKFISDYRKKEALTLMTKGVLSKTDVAQSCGFYDLSHMEKTLKKSV